MISERKKNKFAVHYFELNFPFDAVVNFINSSSFVVYLVALISISIYLVAITRLAGLRTGWGSCISLIL